MKSLVTGACGFSGGFLVPHLIDSGDEVVGTYASKMNIPKDFEAVPLDIRDAKACSALISRVNPDVLYHLAAVTFVPEAEKNFENTLAINVLGTHNLIRACTDLKKPVKFVFISSSEIYGKILPDQLPIKETLPPNPMHNYSLTKVMGEFLVKRFDRDEVQVVIARAFNHIGPRQRLDFVVSAFAHQLAQIKKKKASPVVRVGNLEAKRDFTDVRDIVRGYRLAAEKGRGIYNFCSGRSVSIQNILDRLISIVGVEVKVEVDPERTRPSEVPEIVGDYSKVKSAFGWEPEYSLDDSLRAICDYWLSVV